ncbi:Transcriptional regulator, IclR family OS=Tsukamurella paurometabola (strain ATCC 8368 / DSM/ CCUG 35730 / CIP 100753 / JCM 10117 / KCTC 9821 / NBRC 16120/ NCIMB 702349 / NCTC 13040) OX=521096 GN=Tpau_2849 PE=4 SV=1 [Tsukamurella paurometabola]|uniref:Transcriptional regulator, IclR family n=1 Tax=Tsukamurella paurometabola (strain ATCC 8368 / DSM 20162 / CCUG 35730 / CIP 100753 / JCM 10117 / KCTC 9821 / NBRC 16120 / NCIMB 702349 / NCTC 13040) TaxID=521096 RepID=D5UTG2_TSUPD|nr:IclR family transcriptional regulator [Tsukamurella paurometabola]ADG79447.1 transcriptional regulator, IclR family [Tsukamurella paurometabola DSM 20162]SUP35783.1 Negative regulator of allantoin and glyoxylate utilization operons [Tsukamurella paurometabola]
MGQNSSLADPTESPAPAPVSGIGVLDKSVAVLRAAAAEPASLADLCGRTGLPRATAHRLAVGLELHGLLSRDGDGLWRPGTALRELAASTTDTLVDAAAMVLPRLREITGESVQLYRREGDHRVCVAAAEPPSGLRDTVPVGTRLPMTAGSGAKVLTAWADASDTSFSDRTLSDVRKRGWAQSAGEREAGVASVSAPVRDARGDVIAAISVSGPIDRMGRRPGARWAADLLQAAEALQRRL